MVYRLGDLARKVGGEVRGNPQRSIVGLRTLEHAGPEDLSFVTSPLYRKKAASSAAGALLVGPDASFERDLLVADQPGYALAQLLELFFPREAIEPGIHPTAVLAEDCQVDPSVHVGAHAVIGRGSRLGAGAVVHPLVVVGRNCTVGPGVVLYPHVVLYEGTEVGEGCIIHAGAVLGADGFGYTYHDQSHVKLPQVGRVVVEADVEIGANTAIDRATLEVTRIGRGTKIDNLVQVGHNVTVGEKCILCGQVGLAGSSSLGKGVVMGGQSGLSGHLEIADGGQVAGQSAVFKSVGPGQVVAGTPAIDGGKWRRQVALLSRLETMKRRLDELERKVNRIVEG